MIATETKNGRNGRLVTIVNWLCKNGAAFVFLGISKGTLPHDLLVNQLWKQKSVFVSQILIVSNMHSLFNCSLLRLSLFLSKSKNSSGIGAASGSSSGS